jgi:hypothetical protein
MLNWRIVDQFILAAIRVESTWIVRARSLLNLALRQLLFRLPPHFRQGVDQIVDRLPSPPIRAGISSPDRLPTRPGPSDSLPS